MNSEYNIFGPQALGAGGMGMRRKLRVIAYAAALCMCVQCYNRGVTRVLRALRRCALPACWGAGARGTAVQGLQRTGMTFPPACTVGFRCRLHPALSPARDSTEQGHHRGSGGVPGRPRRHEAVHLGGCAGLRGALPCMQSVAGQRCTNMGSRTPACCAANISDPACRPPASGQPPARVVVQDPNP